MDDRNANQEVPEPSGPTVADTSRSEPPPPGKAHGKTTEVQGDSHFLETVTTAPLNPWSRTSLQLYAILLVASLNATASGFDGVGLPKPPQIRTSEVCGC